MAAENCICLIFCYLIIRLIICWKFEEALILEAYVGFALSFIWVQWLNLFELECIWSHGFHRVKMYTYIWWSSYGTKCSLQAWRELKYETYKLKLTVHPNQSYKNNVECKKTNQPYTFWWICCWTDEFTQTVIFSISSYTWGTIL